MEHNKLQEKHFAALREKYQVGQHKSAKFNNFLYLILRKAELGIQLTNLEFQWLKENQLFTTTEIISLQQYQATEKERLETELLQLKTKYQITTELELPLSSPVYSVLGKLDAGYTATDSELKLLDNHGLVNTIILIQDILIFSKLKVNYQATKHLSQFPEEPLYSILKKLDKRDQLADSEAEWLLENDFDKTLEIYWQQEQERQDKLKFAELKSKYKVSHHPDTSIDSPLYPILKKLNSEEELESSEWEWLEEQELEELIEIERLRKNTIFFAELKNSYKATQYQASDPSSRLFKILRNLEISKLKKTNLSREFQELFKQVEFQVSEEDINYLSKQGLNETTEIAKQIHFKILKDKYRIMGQLAMNPFYGIMLKLEREERLDPKQVIQLIEEDRLSRHGKIAIAYYRLEAIFYEKEYRRTGNRWNLPSASSNWRKASEPDKALKVTENVNWKKIKESDLSSALLVTRGAAFRDLAQLDKAENCAAQAVECQPNNHQPYTLMGAIYYDQGKYSEGDDWFEMAGERGADDTDDEIERIVKMTKDKEKRREVAQYLLNKDPNRYGWANSYLK
ncbi:MAG: hypothetical protein F6K21_33070 [Symploca sp. SIO2D2]|nr:hypothetical protein [Symploca sp. SIO2D2]